MSVCVVVVVSVLTCVLHMHNVMWGGSNEDLFHNLKANKTDRVSAVYKTSSSLFWGLDAGKRNLTCIIIVLFKETDQTQHPSERVCEALPKNFAQQAVLDMWLEYCESLEFFFYSGKQQAEDFHCSPKKRGGGYSRGTYYRAHLCLKNTSKLQFMFLRWTRNDQFL